MTPKNNIIFLRLRCIQKCNEKEIDQRPNKNNLPIYIAVKQFF